MIDRKKCPCCGQEKVTTEFGKDKNRNDGLNPYCKECKRAKDAKYRAENPEKVRGSSAKYRSKHSDKERARSAKWRAENPDKVNAYNAKHRALKQERLHPDHDPVKERELFERAKELEKATGEKYHVDHILPLAKGGWHHYGNMQILPASVNQQKKDSLEWRDPNYLHWTQLPLFLLQGTVQLTP